MDPKIQQQLDEQELKIAEIHTAVKKIEQYLRWTFWVTIIVVGLPAVLLAFALPTMLRTYSATMQGLL